MKQQGAAQEQHDVIGVNEDSGIPFACNCHPDAAWFKKENLGLFIHWGICTVHGDIDLSWGMMANKPYELLRGYNKYISPAEYFALAESFQPTQFDINAVLKTAKEAGFQYAVFTTKHHDGFALWPSAQGGFHVGNTLPGRDFVREYTEACRANGLKTGLYYSPPDWYYMRNHMSFNYCSNLSGEQFPDCPHEEYDIRLKPAQIRPPSEELTKSFRRYQREQIIELLTQYGKIDMLWFDGGVSAQPCITIEEIRALQPGILINPRLHGTGDFRTFECRLPDTPPDGIWEHENIWAEGSWWAEMKDVGYKSAEWAWTRYQTVCEMGGNFLLNIGLCADGSMPKAAQQRFEEWKAVRGSRTEEKV